MNTNIKNQKGMATMGWVGLFVSISFVVLMAMRIIPAYTEFMSIERAFNAVEKADLPFKTASSIRSAFTKRFIVDSVRTINSTDVKVDTRGEKIRVWVDYEVRLHVFSNIDAIVSFEKEIFLSRK